MRRINPNVAPALLLLALGAFIAVPLSAQSVQEECPLDKPWTDCLTEGLNRRSNLIGLVKEETNSEIDEQSLQNLIGAATSSEINLEDFLSSLLANLDIDDLEETDGGLRFKKNFQVASGTLAVEALAKKGELFPELKMKLEEAKLDDLIETLDGELQDFDNRSLGILFSVDRSGENDIWWGRRFRSPRGEATSYAKISGSLFEEIPIQESSDLASALVRLNEAINELGGPTSTPGEMKVESRSKINGVVRSLVKAQEADVEQFTAAIKENKLFDFGRLVANQPQLVVSASYNFHDELTGRDNYSASLKYEVGQANVNGLRRFCGSNGVRLGCYKKFLEREKDALKKNWRVAFEATYTWLDDFSYTSPDETFNLSLDSSQSWDISLSAGRSIRLDSKGDEITRLDLEGIFQDGTGEGLKQSRFLATTTFTQKINERFSLSVGFVYANRPEFRGDVDEELSARAGLRFSLEDLNDS